MKYIDVISFLADACTGRDSKRQKKTKVEHAGIAGAGEKSASNPTAFGATTTHV